MKKEWYLKNAKFDINQFKCFNINEELYQILASRNIRTKEDIEYYLYPSLDKMYDPFLMKDMDKGIDIILDAVIKGKKITIWGDFDSDGINSTAILYKGLSSINANIDYYIPDRELDGYGMNIRGIELLKEQGTEVILTCDNGISAVEQINYAKLLGFTVIVTDHHNLPFTEANGERNYNIPNADAIINPKRIDCQYPFKDLCGAGIAFKFIIALYHRINKKMPLQLFNELLELAAVGTIGDVVSLIGENRIIAKNGMHLLDNPTNKGLKILREELNVADKEITSYIVGFLIVPSLNSSGRIENAKIATEILISEDETFIREKAKKLVELNEYRKDLTEKGVESAIKIIEEKKLNDLYTVLVIYDESIHESIAGIVAGRIREQYNKPTIILTNSAKENIIKGSGRSIEEYNMFEEILKIKDYTVSFGGHPMAVGLSLEKNKLEQFIININNLSPLKNIKLINKLKIDCCPKAKNINLNLVRDIKLLEPFGKDNPGPVFAKKNVKIKRIFTMGSEGQHLKFICNIDGCEFTVVAFSMKEKFIDELKTKYNEEQITKIINNSFCDNVNIDIVFNPKANNYKDNTYLQLVVSDLRLTKNSKKVLQNNINRILNVG